MKHSQIATNGISMHVVEDGPPGRPVLLCHGFPELWYSWRHQLPALAAAGYHAIAPDQRGYGRTDRPAEITDYDIHHLSGDLIGLLDHYGYEQAVLVGHDWGAILTWHFVTAYPERVRAACALSVPYRPRGRNVPTESMRRRFGDSFYIVRFQQVGPPDTELGSDARATMTRMLTGSAEGTLPSWLTHDDLDFFCTEFERTGFTGGLNWYRNFDRNWATTEHLAGAKVTCPALFIAGSKDAVLATTPTDAMEANVPDLRGSMWLDAGHWVQQERPDEVNVALIDFLRGL